MSIAGQFRRPIQPNSRPVYSIRPAWRCFRHSERTSKGSASVELWLAGGERYHPKSRRRISSPDEVLPCWRAGIEAAAVNPVHRDLLLFGLYIGMRKGEVEALHWDRVDLEAGLFQVDETKTGTPLELPVTRQIGEILARRRADGEALPTELRAWVFPAPSSATGHVVSLGYYYGRITKAGGVKFRFHGLRNAFAIVWSSPAVLGVLHRLYALFYMGFLFPSELSPRPA